MENTEHKTGHIANMPAFPCGQGATGMTYREYLVAQIASAHRGDYVPQFYVPQFAARCAVSLADAIIEELAKE